MTREQMERRIADLELDLKVAEHLVRKYKNMMFGYQIRQMWPDSEEAQRMFEKDNQPFDVQRAMAGLPQ